MSKINDGGPAFPLINRDYQEAYGGAPGMTLRDWFAGQVLGGIMSVRSMRFDPKDEATYCYRVADAMLAAREGEKP